MKLKAGELSVIVVLNDRIKVNINFILEFILKKLRTDMWDGYIYAVIKVFGKKAVVIEHVHVANQYHESLNKLRVLEMKHVKIE